MEIRRIARIVRTMGLVVGLVLLIATTAPFATAQQDTGAGKPAGGQMKQGGKELGEAGKSLGHDVRHGHVVKGGKDFGKHTYRGGKHIGKGTAKGAHKAGSAVKKSVTP